MGEEMSTTNRVAEVSAKVKELNALLASFGFLGDWSINLPLPLIYSITGHASAEGYSALEVHTTNGRVALRPEAPPLPDNDAWLKNRIAAIDAYIKQQCDTIANSGQFWNTCSKCQKGFSTQDPWQADCGCDTFSVTVPAPQEYKGPPVCDCGAAKAKTTHARWCSLNETK